MKLKPIKLILTLSVLSAAALNIFAQNHVVTSSTTENNQSYEGIADDAALRVEGSGVTYNGTNITLSNTFNGGTYADDRVGRGLWVGSGGVLFLTGGSITTTGTYGHGIVFNANSSGTLNGVYIETNERNANGVATGNFASLTMTGGTVTTNGYGEYAVSLGVDSSSTLNNVVIESKGDNNAAVRVSSATLEMTGGSITLSGNAGSAIYASNASSSTLKNLNMEVGDAGRGVYLLSGATANLTDSNIHISGSGSYGFLLTGTSSLTANLNGNTLGGSGADNTAIRAMQSSTVALTGSNGSIITGNVTGTSYGNISLALSGGSELHGDVTSSGGATVAISLSGAGTEMHGNLILSGGGIYLTLSDGALLDGNFTVKKNSRITGGGGIFNGELILESGAIIGYADGGLLVTGSLSIGNGILVDLSALTGEGAYTVLDWSGASVSSSITDTQFTVTNLDESLQGTFSVDNNQLTFNATAVPEPATWFLIGFGLGALALIRRR
ncbi:MAG: PEP-CTERM sorting domain-containing protein [Verrucomicrobiales bacterium]|jgi:hypothetical protein|nr:PEP-CTERM sorting domain-containing protein [Verrucomicrobiales bacterium]